MSAVLDSSALIAYAQLDPEAYLIVEQNGEDERGGAVFVPVLALQEALPMLSADQDALDTLVDLFSYEFVKLRADDDSPRVNELVRQNIPGPLASAIALAEVTDSIMATWLQEPYDKHVSSAVYHYLGPDPRRGDERYHPTD